MGRDGVGQLWVRVGVALFASGGAAGSGIGAEPEPCVGAQCSCARHAAPPCTLTLTYLHRTAPQEARRDADSYLFDLHHYVLMHADTTVKERDRAALPGLPFAATPDSEHLVIDAHTIGGWVGGWVEVCALVGLGGMRS